MNLSIFRKGSETELVPLGWRYTAGIQRWILLLIMGLAAVIVMGCVSYEKPAPSAISYQPLTCIQPMCEEVAVQRGDITLSVQAIGNVRSKREDYAAPARGRVASVDVSAGDKIQKGQVLIGLDPTPLELAVVEARIALLGAEGALKNLQQLPASEASERAQALVVDTQSKVDSARKELELAESGLSSQQVTRIKTDINVAKAMVRETLWLVQELTHNPATQSLAEAHLTRSNAEFALEEAENALTNLAQNHNRQSIEAHRATAEAEAALLTAEQALKDFRSQNYAQRLVDARRAEMEAEIKLEQAEQALSNFHAVTWHYSQDALDRMTQLKKGVELARAELDITRENLATLDDYDPQLLQQLEAAAKIARSDLKAAEESLVYFDREANPQNVASSRDKLAATESELEVVQEALAVLDHKTDASASAIFERLPRDRALLEAKAAELEADLAMHASALRAIEAGVSRSEVALLEAKIVQARNDLGAANEVIHNIESAPSTTPALETLQEVHDALNKLQLTLQSTPEGAHVAQLELGSVEGRLLEVRESLQGLEGTPNQLDLEFRRKQLEVARENLAEAEENLQNATIVAPFDGVVSALNVEKGQRVNAGDLMIQLIDYSAPEVVAQVPAMDVAQVQEGQKVSFTVGEFSDTVLSGRVTRISGVPDIPAPNTQTGFAGPMYEVVISSEALQSASLIEGMPASVTITIDERRDVLLVPTTVLNGSTNDMPQVEVVNGGGTEPVSISLGLKNGHLVEVKDGLREGDVVRVHRGSTRELGNGNVVKEPNTNSSLVKRP